MRFEENPLFSNPVANSEISKRIENATVSLKYATPFPLSQ